MPQQTKPALLLHIKCKWPAIKQKKHLNLEVKMKEMDGQKWRKAATINFMDQLNRGAIRAAVPNL